MAPSTRTHGVNTAVAFVFGVVFLIVGIIGFFLTGLSGFADPAAGKTLVIFDVNPLHNIVHLAIGLLLLGASRSVAASRAANGTVGLVYLLVGLLGLFIASPSNPINIIALNGADNVLHLGSAIVLMGAAAAADRSARAVRA